MSMKHEKIVDDDEARGFRIASDKLLLNSLEISRSFSHAVEDFRKLEAEFVARLSDDEVRVLELRRAVAGTILLITQCKRPPFDVCREVWNGLVYLGFSDTEVECSSSGLYADCCAYDERPDEGLAVLLPLIAMLEQRQEEAKGTGMNTEYPAYDYESWIERIRNLRDVLEAQKRGEVIPERETRRGDEAAAD